MKIKTKAIRNGIIAVFIVLGLNLLVLSILKFPSMATDIIGRYWYLLIFLIGGFGFQVGLFTYLKSAISCSTTVVSGGVSGVSMILCCSHYLLNLLPFLGAIIGASALIRLSEYTPHFLVLGIVSNFFGIGIMFYQKNKKMRKIHSSVIELKEGKWTKE